VFFRLAEKEAHLYRKIKRKKTNIASKANSKLCTY